jgi:hypothetical protein
MGKNKKPPAGPKVDKGADKSDIKSRKDCSELVDSKASTSPIWIKWPAVQDSGKNLVAAGVALASADKDYIQAMADAEAKRGIRETKLTDWNNAHDVYVSNVETYAVKPEDITLLGLHAAAKTAYALAVPLSILLKQDMVKHLLRIHVKLPPGMKAAEIEVSTDGTTYKRLTGHGVKRTIPNPTPGNCWVRAASSRASVESAFTDPVQIVVK